MKINKANLNRAQGFSLIEVMIATAITVIIIGAIGAILQPLLNLKNQLDTNSGLYSATMYFRDCIANDAAWANTVAANQRNSFQCLNGSGCIDQSAGTAIGIPLSLMSKASTLCLDGYDTMDGSTSGFTKDGVVCQGFSTSGNPLCPYRMNFNWMAICPLVNQSRCTNPIIKVVGRMVHPTTVNPNPGQPPAVQLDLAKFNINVIRGRADQVRSFTMLETSPIQGCRAGVANYRVFHVYQDEGRYTHGTSPFGGTADAAFTLEPGTYDCEISVPGFLIGNFRAALFNTSNMTRPLLQGTSEFSPAFWGYNQTRSFIVGTFTLPTFSRLVVAEWCTNAPTDSTLFNESMGVPSHIPLGGIQDVFSTLHCSVLSPAAN